MTATRKTISRVSIGDNLYRRERGKFVPMGRVEGKEKTKRGGLHVTLNHNGRRTTYNAGGATVVWVK